MHHSRDQEPKCERGLISLQERRVHFHGLDVLRTVLAMTVALGHFFLWNQISTVVPSTFFLAVDFFFVLSGFVLMQSTVRNRSLGFIVFTRDFLVRRAVRLYPLYLCVLILTVGSLIHSHGFQALTFSQGLVSLALLQSIGVHDSGVPIYADTAVGIAWSVSVEFWMSLFFFCCAYLLQRFLKSFLFFCVLLTVGSFFLLVKFSPNALNVNMQGAFSFLSFGQLRGLIGFSLGSIGYFCFLFIQPKRPKSVLVTLCETGLILLLGVLYFHHGEYNKNFEYLTPLLATVSVVIVALQSGFFSRLLCIPEFHSLRPISYAIYLIHPLVIMAFRAMKYDFSVETSVVFSVIVLLLSGLAYRYIEKPGMGLRRYLIS